MLLRNKFKTVVNIFLRMAWFYNILYT